MKKLFVLMFLAGCSPAFMDFSIGLGSNQTIDKTLKVNQKQTKAQSDSATSVVDDVISVLPIFLVPEPTPTPAPRRLRQTATKKAKNVTSTQTGTWMIVPACPTPMPTPTPLPTPATNPSCRVGGVCTNVRTGLDECCFK